MKATNVLGKAREAVNTAEKAGGVLGKVKPFEGLTKLLANERGSIGLGGKVAEAAAKGGRKAKPYSDPENRPPYAKGQVDNAWENAKDVDGKVYDPNTGEGLTWDKSSSRAGQWDMGHTPENKYSEWHEKYLNALMNYSNESAKSVLPNADFIKGLPIFTHNVVLTMIKVLISPRNFMLPYKINYIGQ